MVSLGGSALCPHGLGCLGLAAAPTLPCFVRPRGIIIVHLMPAGVLCAGHGPCPRDEAQLRRLLLPVQVSLWGCISLMGTNNFNARSGRDETQPQSALVAGRCPPRAPLMICPPSCCLRLCSFGKTPPPEAEDPAFATPCFQQCPTARRAPGAAAAAAAAAAGAAAAGERCHKIQLND